MGPALAWYDEKSGHCTLCPHRCYIGPGKKGLCGVRSHDDWLKGTPSWYGRVSALALDPIEKKPLRHFHPGSMILSVGFYGCNARCPFCQNWEISQEYDYPREGIMLPSELLSLAIKEKSFGIAFTYSEPIIHFEYLRDAMQVCHDRNLRTVLVSNGNMLEEPARELFALTDACNIDFKTWSPDDAKSILGIDLECVKKCIEIAYQTGTHLEISTLVVPGFNDDIEKLMGIAEWIAVLDDSIPWHIAACHPAWHYKGPSTDPKLLWALKERAAKVLKHVYTGNI